MDDNLVDFGSGFNFCYFTFASGYISFVPGDGNKSSWGKLWKLNSLSFFGGFVLALALEKLTYTKELL